MQNSRALAVVVAVVAGFTAACIPQDDPPTPIPSTTRVSISSDGTQANGMSVSSSSAISDDGRYVAFDSYASNLVPDDTNAAHDVFVHDRNTATTTRVSVASDGTQANLGTVWAAINADGRYVVLTSDASNLVTGDSNSEMDVFVRDRGM